MRTPNRLVAAALAVFGLMAVYAAPAAAADSATAPEDALTDARFYTGAIGSQGVFPGKLVCLCCDFQKGDAGKAPCKETSHRYALKIDGDPTIHPLIPGDAVAMKQLNSAALHDKQVTVTGKLYPTVGIILVAGITPN